MEKIAIIGMGISGMAALSAYVKETNLDNFEFDLYDTKESFGKGFPYREDTENIIVNLKTRKISYDYQNNDDFAAWHKENGLEEIDYPSRTTFGNYMRDRLEETIAKTKSNKIYEKVTRIDKVNEKWEVESESGKVVTYDRIHLGIGELGQRDLFNLNGSKNYINDIFPLDESIKEITEDDVVCVIGMGLTGVDVIVDLLKKNKGKKIFAFSRTCVIPTVRVAPVMLEPQVLTMDRLNEELNKNFGRISFKKFDTLFLEELSKIDVNYEEFLSTHMQGGIEGIIYNIENPEKLAKVQALLPLMNLVFNKVWDSMTKKDRILMKSKYHPFLCLNRSPLPLDSAKILIDAYKNNKLEVIKNVMNIETTSDNKFRIIFSDDTKDIENIDFTLNATGIDATLENVENQNELLAQLIDKRYLMKDENGGVLIIPETMAAISPRFGTLPNFHVYGVLAIGNQYRNNSTMIIQNTAHRVVKNLYINK